MDICCPKKKIVFLMRPHPNKQTMPLRDVCCTVTIASNYSLENQKFQDIAFFREVFTAHHLFGNAAPIQTIHCVLVENEQDNRYDILK